MRPQGSPHTGALIGLLVLAAGAANAPSAPDPAGGVLVLLPLEDRTGDPEGVALVEEALRAEVGASYRLLDPGAVRDTLRRLRIREVGAVPPEVLRRLAEATGADRFLSATLHDAHAGEVPRVCIAARLFAAGRREIEWAGFQAATGPDGTGWLGLGRTEDLGTVARAVARGLVQDLQGTVPPRTRDLPRVRDRFRGEGIARELIGTVAVIPFDTAVEGVRASAMLGDLARAVLHRHGIASVNPGLVGEILLQREVIRHGEFDPLTRAALRAGAGADLLFTGTVEAWEGAPEGGAARIALAARLVDADTGRIVWMAAVEDRIPPPGPIFPRRRAGSIEQLAERMLEALVIDLAGNPSRQPRKAPV